MLRATGTETGINTAYIERLNATFRSSRAALTRRGRAFAHTEAALTAGMYLVGCAYNSCWNHQSLRVQGADDESPRWQERTPAMAAGLMDHRWTMQELLTHPIPLPPWVAPKRRGRPPKAKQPSVVVANHSSLLFSGKTRVKKKMAKFSNARMGPVNGQGNRIFKLA